MMASKTPMMMLSEQMKAGGPLPFKALCPGDDGYPEGHTGKSRTLFLSKNLRLRLNGK